MITSKSTPSKINFLEDFVDNSKPTIIYFHGAGERTATNNINDLNKLKSLAFFTKFYTDNKGRYNFFMPQQTTGSFSWVYPIRNNVSYGVEFIKWVIETYNLDKIILTGHSMGSPWTTAEIIPELMLGIAVVSGSGNYQGCVRLGQLKLPVIAWHGESDTTTPNDFISGKKACVTWFQNTGGGSPIWNPLPGVGHGADSHAYSSTGGFKEFVDSLTVATPQPLPLVDLIVKFDPNDSTIKYFDSNGNQY